MLKKTTLFYHCKSENRSDYASDKGSVMQREAAARFEVILR